MAQVPTRPDQGTSSGTPPRSRPLWKRWWVWVVAVVVVLIALTQAQNGELGETTSVDQTAKVDSGEATCSKFRDVAAGSLGPKYVGEVEGALSSAEVAAGLEEVGRLAQDATDTAIRDAGQQVGREANVRTMFSGSPNAAQDALADACNRLFPI